MSSVLQVVRNVHQKPIVLLVSQDISFIRIISVTIHVHQEHLVILQQNPAKNVLSIVCHVIQRENVSLVVEITILE